MTHDASDYENGVAYFSISNFYFLGGRQNHVYAVLDHFLARDIVTISFFLRVCKLVMQFDIGYSIVTLILLSYQPLT